MDKLDKTDKKILRILQSRARVTNAQLSKEIGLSPAPTLERVKKLEKKGYIEGYRAELNYQSVGLDVITFIQVTLKNNKKETIAKFVDHINQVDEIVECFHLTGHSDVLLKVITDSISTYQNLIIEKLTAFDEIDKMESMVVLSTLKKSNNYPIS